jgi:hypothetical protein
VTAGYEHQGGETERVVRRRAAARRSALGFAISAVSLLGVAWWARGQDPPTFPSSGGKLALVAFALFVYAAATVCRGFRWHVILRHSRIRHAPADAYGLATVAYMGNAVLPARGGELLRILLMAERSTGRRLGIAGTILAERLLDALTLARSGHALDSQDQ